MVIKNERIRTRCEQFGESDWKQKRGVHGCNIILLEREQRRDESVESGNIKFGWDGVWLELEEQ